MHQAPGGAHKTAEWRLHPHIPGGHSKLGVAEAGAYPVPSPRPALSFGRGRRGCGRGQLSVELLTLCAAPSAVAGVDGAVVSALVLSAGPGWGRSVTNHGRQNSPLCRQSTRLRTQSQSQSVTVTAKITVRQSSRPRTQYEYAITQSALTN